MSNGKRETKDVRQEAKKQEKVITRSLRQPAPIRSGKQSKIFGRSLHPDGSGLVMTNQ